jgi:hypothetical protein
MSGSFRTRVDQFLHEIDAIGPVSEIDVVFARPEEIQRRVSQLDDLSTRILGAFQADMAAAASDSTRKAVEHAYEEVHSRFIEIVRPGSPGASNKLRSMMDESIADMKRRQAASSTPHRSTPATSSAAKTSASPTPSSAPRGYSAAPPQPPPAKSSQPRGCAALMGWVAATTVAMVVVGLAVKSATNTFWGWIAGMAVFLASKSIWG